MSVTYASPNLAVGPEDAAALKRLFNSRFLAFGLLLASMAVLAQTATDRLESNRNFDDVVVDQINEDAGLWRETPEPDVENQWRAAPAKPMERDSRVTWGYDSSYEELGARRNERDGLTGFNYDYGEERAGTVLRFNF